MKLKKFRFFLQLHSGGLQNYLIKMIVNWTLTTIAKVACMCSPSIGNYIKFISKVVQLFIRGDDSFKGCSCNKHLTILFLNWQGNRHKLCEFNFPTFLVALISQIMLTVCVLFNKSWHYFIFIQTSFS